MDIFNTYQPLMMVLVTMLGVATQLVSTAIIVKRFKIEHPQQTTIATSNSFNAFRFWKAVVFGNGISLLAIGASVWIIARLSSFTAPLTIDVFIVVLSLFFLTAFSACTMFLNLYLRWRGGNFHS